MNLTPPLKWHGGKHYLAAKIIELMPPHTHYVEPYFGGGAVLLAKNPEGVSEVVNDVNSRLMNFWRVLRNELSFAAMIRKLEATPFSEATWEEAFRSPDGGPIDRAAKFLVLCRQSMAGRMDAFAPLSRTRTRRGMNEQASAWLTAIEGLPAVHARLKRVVVLNSDALDVIRQQDGKDTLFYLDPPYLQATRTAPDVYAHEMSYEQHQSLLELLATIKGTFLLSGYDSDLYRGYERANRWHRREFDLPNNSASGTAKERRKEIIWLNYPRRLDITP